MDIVTKRASREQVAELVKECLREGKTVDIDGLGLFRPTGNGDFEFVAASAPKIFLAYVEEDFDPADRLYHDFLAQGFDPWIDRRKLLPGQNWPRAIEHAIDHADFFVACFSRRAVAKKGGFQAEIRYALDCARRVPLDDTFLIPVRLEDCPVPARIQQEIQYIDLFPNWERGVRRILRVVERQLKLLRISNGRGNPPGAEPRKPDAA